MTFYPPRTPAWHSDPPVDAVDAAPLDPVARLVYPGVLAFVPFTAPQLDLLMEVVGTHAGRLADEPLAPSDAYVPFAELQSYLHRFHARLTEGS